MKTILIRKRKGKARPKNAGNQNRTGEMYFAETENKRQRMKK
ncbi:MAG TPA: hypothetical protein PLU73_02090 [Bacteroidia bacterium]|jgi:hypothetical protein|nr:hypothetical protein [Bacteroidia bacterium]